MLTNVMIINIVLTRLDLIDACVILDTWVMDFLVVQIPMNASWTTMSVTLMQNVKAKDNSQGKNSVLRNRKSQLSQFSQSILQHWNLLLRCQEIIFAKTFRNQDDSWKALRLKIMAFYPLTDNEGSYACKCLNGFRGYGFECFDVDECSDQPDVCSGSEEGITTCINTIGSYYCQCNNGWIMVRFAWLLLHHT